MMILVANKKEEPGETYLHNIQTSKKLIDSARKQQACRIKTEFCDIECMVAIDEPEETKS